MRLPTLSASGLFSAGIPAGWRLVDLRSPAEFARDHLPGAVNVPLLEDDQRALVGTLYKQVSPEVAFATGLDLVRPRIVALLEQILGDRPSEIDGLAAFEEVVRQLREERLHPPEMEPVATDALGDEAVVVHCWRGGMRSRSVALLLRALGHDRVVVLEGGYKAYRQWVMAQLEAIPPNLPLVVLRGQTGVGKTRWLREVEQRSPGTVLDLEGLAGHRSSVLGAVGLKPVGQAAFEGRLVARLRQLRTGAFAQGPWWVEGESRKIGDVIIPAGLFRAMTDAVQVRLTADPEWRIEQLGSDYLAEGTGLEESAVALDGLRAKLGHATVDRLQHQILSGAWREAVAVLLAQHYDPLYRRDEEGHQWLAELAVGDGDLVGKLIALRDGLATVSG